MVSLALEILLFIGQNHRVLLSVCVVWSCAQVDREGVYGEENTFQPEHLCDNLIGLIGPDVHLESGGWLEQFPHSR